jgi:GNAT superfamily N-acetyltransferase
MGAVRKPRAAVHFAEAGPNHPAFEEAMDIYEAAFPPTERQPLEVILSRVSTGVETLWIGSVGREVQLMALVWDFAGSDYLYLDYMAVRADRRGSGAGSHFLQHLLREASELGKSILIEVEDPDFGEDHTLRERRMCFYKRAGAREMKEVRYLLPPLQGVNPTEMRLLVLSPRPKDTLDGQGVQKLVQRLYSEVYGRKAIDPLVLRTLSTIGDRVSLS